MTKDEVIQQILERLGKFLGRPVKEEELEQGYDTLGADSMDMVVLAYELEKLLETDIKPEIFMQHETIRGALDAIMQETEDV
jgi:acyl carrier protein